MDIGVYGALLLSGFLGSLGHCLGMCGPLMVMVGLQFRARGPVTLPRHLLYHVARIAVYVLLGAVVGGIGSLLGLGSRLNSLAGVASVLLGLGVVLLGVGYLGWLPLGRIEGAGTWLNQAMGRALERGGLWGVILLGALNGLLPCGLTYSALLVAATTGGPLSGALAMGLFGIGTAPALLVVGLGVGELSVRARQAMVRVAGVLIVVVGLQLVLRGLAALGALPHLHLGGVLIW
jgi:sulfite exporter TauE/SafE